MNWKFRIIANGKEYNFVDVNEIIAKDRYCAEQRNKDNGKIEWIENWDSCNTRVSDYLVLTESSKKKYWASEFKSIIQPCYGIPAGRIWKNAEKPKASMLNCFVRVVDNDIESIAKLISDVMIITKYEGGVGIDFSSLTPKDVYLTSTQVKASGPVSFMSIVDKVASVIQIGNRRAALLACLNVSHPDVLEFIHSKKELGILSNFNISVGITNEFIDAVKKDSVWELKWNNKIFKKIKAKVLWDEIIQCMFKYGEPGLLNLSNLHEHQSLSYLNQTILTNPSLRKGTKVLTNLGIFSIEELEHKTFKVKNICGEWVEAKCFLSGNFKNLLKIILDGDIVYYATPEHKWPIALLDGGFGKICTKNLEEGQYLFSEAGKVRIKAIQPTALYEDVWDITVFDNTHTFQLAEGVITGNCGEAPLVDKESCCLASINLTKMMKGPKEIDWDTLAKTIRVLVRMLDNVLSINTYPPSTGIEQATLKSRRLGLGVMGLANFFIMNHIKYGSEEAFELTSKLIEFIRNHAYLASVDLAKERGSFPSFDKKKYLETFFASKLPRNVRKAIEKQGIRNANLISLAPTGTISLLVGTSSGIEPIYDIEYERPLRVRDYELYENPKFDNPYKHKKGLEDSIHLKVTNPLWESGEYDKGLFVTAKDLTIESHLEIQSVIQDKIDGSISKTVNCPNDITGEGLSEVVLEYISNLKGLTVYRDGSRDSVLSSGGLEEQTSCPTGTCEV